VSFKDVIGQENAVRLLTGAIKRGRIASSYLFAGEQGIGKKFTAVNFAKALNCLNPVDFDACDECPSCKKIDAGTHPDFLVIESEGEEIKVDAIRKLEEVLSLKAYEAGTKVVIVDDAERMNIHAANAFLKTLEEPPSGSLIILVSSSPDRLPETIRSRCLRINFTPLSPEACATVIEKSSRKHKDIQLLVRLSMGRAGLALKEDLIKERDSVIEALSSMPGGKQPWGDRKDMEKWFDTALLLLRDMAVLKITGSADELINKDIAEKIKDMSSNTALKVIINCYEKFLYLRNSLGFNLNKAITWNYTGSIMEELKSHA
jgi:DNA polymerase-3 subunit delta'